METPVETLERYCTLCGSKKLEWWENNICSDCEDTFEATS